MHIFSSTICKNNRANILTRASGCTKMITKMFKVLYLQNFQRCSTETLNTYSVPLLLPPSQPAYPYHTVFWSYWPLYNLEKLLTRKYSSFFFQSLTCSILSKVFNWHLRWIFTHYLCLKTLVISYNYRLFSWFIKWITEIIISYNYMLIFLIVQNLKW